MSRSEPEVAVTNYGSLLRRRWKAILVGLVVGLAAAAVASYASPGEYRSTTSVLVQPTGDDTNVTNGRTTSVINLDTEAQIVTSSVVSNRAKSLLDTPDSGRTLAKRVAVGVPPNTSVLNITFAAATPAGARSGARAFAKAYLANRQAVAENRLQAQQDKLQDSIADLNKRLEAINQELTQGPEPARANYLQAQRTLLIGQIRTSTDALSPLTTTDVVPGAVITDAQLPTARSGRNLLLLGASGLIGGLLVGFAIALFRDRRDRRVYDTADIERLGPEVLVGGFDLPQRSEVLRQRRGQDEPLRQVRNALLSRMLDHRGIVVVSGASQRPEGSTAAAALAVTLSRSGVQTALVCANTERDVVSEVFGTCDGPTLADVLLGRAEPADSLHEVPYAPDLLVVAPGRDGALYSELLQEHVLAPTLAALEAEVEVVVLDVAPVASNADAQTIVIGSAGLVLVVTEGITTIDEIHHAMAQMASVETDLLGVMSVRPSTEEPDAVAHTRLLGAGSAVTGVEYRRQVAATPVVPLPAPAPAVLTATVTESLPAPGIRSSGADTERDPEPPADDAPAPDPESEPREAAADAHEADQSGASESHEPASEEPVVLAVRAEDVIEGVDGDEESMPANVDPLDPRWTLDIGVDGRRVWRWTDIS